MGVTQLSNEWVSWCWFHRNRNQDGSSKVQLRCWDAVGSVPSCWRTQPVLGNRNQQLWFSELVSLNLSTFCLKVACRSSVEME